MVRCHRCQRRLPSSGECAFHGRPSTVVSVEPASGPHVTPPAGWALGAQIAEGGTALVYSVRRDSGASAIMKWGRWRDRDIHARFAFEADVLRSLGAPIAPAYVEHGDRDGWPYLIMEHVAGETLAAWMARHGDRGGIGQIIAILTRIASALAAVHQRGVIHRDLKPENVMIGAQGVRLLDFGLAKPAGGADAVRRVGAIAGTVHYLAPEVLAGTGPIDHRADLYSFGVLAYEMIAGQPPFVGERRAIEYNHRLTRPPPLRERRDVSAALEDIVLACLAKEAGARPQDADTLRAALSSAMGAVGTLRGVGGATKSIGNTNPVVLVWIEGGDPVAVVRAITDVSGIVVGRRGDGVVAAFASLHHEAPLAVAVSACRELARAGYRCALHASDALVRRSAQGKTSVYGEDVERLDRWVPRAPWSGVVATAAAAALAPDGFEAIGEPQGMFREIDRANRPPSPERTREPALVGRARVVESIVAAVTAPSAALVAVSGESGIGKSRVLADVVARLRDAGRDVVVVPGRRRFWGDRGDDDRLIAALGGGVDLADAFAGAGGRGAIVVLDDVHCFSGEVIDTLLNPGLGAGCVVSSASPLLEAEHGAPASAVSIVLPPLAFHDADVLLRALLEPARLIPGVLVERLAVRAGGNPRVLVALARELQHRGAVRASPAGDEWYVAPDELDTLLVPPGPAWHATRALEDLRAELVPVVRTCAALGPRFAADELAAVLAVPELPTLLGWLVRDGLLCERGGWYEFVDIAVQEAIYDYVLDERALVHARALAFWLAHRGANVVGRLARVGYHAAGAGQLETAGACWIALARACLRRGELRAAEELLTSAQTRFAALARPELAEAVRALDD